MEHPIQRRRDVRARASPPAQIVRRGSVEKIEIVDASFRGLFVRTFGRPPPTSQLLKLQIELPTRTIQLHVVPVRIVTDGSGCVGIGVRFFLMDSEDRQAWDTYVNGLLRPRRMAA